MYGIRVKQTFLDLYPNTALSVEMNSPLYFGSDVDFIQGSFVFPISVPLSPHNNIRLRQPSALDNAFPFIADEPCDVYVSDSNILRGALTVISATKKQAEIHVIISATQLLKETPLNDFFKDIIVEYPNFITKEAFAYNSCQYPTNYPFIFHPVYNEDWDTTKTASAAKWQNPVQVVSDPTEGNIAQFCFAPHAAFTPFVRLDYVLESLVNAVGYGFNNQFQTSAELKQLTLYNNRSLINWTSDTDHTFAPHIKLGHHLPNTKAGEFLKNIARTFNQGLFIDNFENMMELLPAESVFETDKVVDWTSKLLSNFSVSESKDLIRRFNFEENTDNLPDFKLTQSVLGDREFKAKYMAYPSVKATDLEQSVNNFAPISVPNLRTNGSQLYFDVTKNADFATRLMLYRGLTDYEDQSIDTTDPFNPVTNFAASYGYPLAACETTDANGKPVKIGNDTVLHRPNGLPITAAQHSLHWQGEHGIFEKFWKNWFAFLQQKREVKVRLLLTTKDIQQFSFKQKVRLQNRNYLVKKLKINATSKGLQPTEVELVAII